MTSKDEAKALIEAAVTAAVEASMRELDEKLQAAVNLGVTIGSKHSRQTFHGLRPFTLHEIIKYAFLRQI